MNQTSKKQQVLFACSEMTPLVKTGGLADVCGSLPQALKRSGTDVRIVLPGYRSILQEIAAPEFLCTLDLALGPVAICSTTINDINVLLLCHPVFTNRDGNPYMSDDDRGWPDNPMRYALLSQAVVKIAMNESNLDWQPDVVHCHDWQTGLVPALLALQYPRPATIFTIHNLAYQGNIMQNLYSELDLPAALFHPNGLEFWGQASYIKGGIAYADRVNTVSAGYAEEIKTAEFGNGMDGLLRSRSQRVSGILNGIDESLWDPLSDPTLPKNFGIKTLNDKKFCKAALQKEMGLPVDETAMVCGVISRLAEQKGIDIIIDAISKRVKDNLQLIVLGTGETDLQVKLLDLQNKHDKQVAVRIGFDESLSRLIEAGSDVFLMPSRYEPCGLNQMYSLRYGTLPVVTNVGGLADTVMNYDSNNPDKANGFVLTKASSDALQSGIEKSLKAFTNKKLWKQLQTNGMSACFSWDESALKYQQLYEKAMIDADTVNQQMSQIRQPKTSL